MKNTLLVVCVLLAQITMGQKETRSATQAMQLKTAVIWAEDFGNGIPSDWINTETGNIAHWEYRGPATVPDNTVGSRGTCNVGYGPVITSPTSSNGFVLFDSNYWDNDQQPCDPAYFGTGPAPGPHLAYLQTPSINLSTVDYPAIEFYQYLRYYQGETRLEYSISQGPWTNAFQNNIGMGNETASADWKRILLPAACANQADIRFRFVYDGFYYWWQLDDISITNAPPNDMRILHSEFSHFDPTVTNPTGFEWMHYSAYPQSMDVTLKPKATAYNNGSQSQTGVSTIVNVARQDNGVSVGLVSGSVVASVAPSISNVISATNISMPADTGHYWVITEIIQNEVDADPSNNTDSLTLWIDDCRWSHDDAKLEAIYHPLPNNSNQPFDMGSVYLPTNDIYIKKIGAVISDSTSDAIVDSIPFYGVIKDLSIVDTIYFDPLYQTNTVYAQVEDLSAWGEEKEIILPFADSILLQAGHPYFVGLHSELGAEQIKVGQSGVAPQFSAWMLTETSFIFMPNYPMVRLYTCDEITLPIDTTDTNIVDTTFIGHLNTFDFRLFPNPSQDFIQVNLAPGMVVSRYRLMNATGQILEDNKWSNTAIPVAHLPEGLYWIELYNADIKVRKRWIRQNQ